ncbi:MAG TPA: hypothetical protein VHE35_13075 [Kofleriaceae bacterium]|nr:hypothetical protein [Kofleriaceae bacterium]
MARHRWTRPWGAAVSVVALVATAWPLRREPVRHDDFPLSTYPMFALRRKDARVHLDYVIAASPAGGRRPVPPGLVAGPEVMQAMMTVNRAVSHGQADTLCAEVAARLATRLAYVPFDTVQVITGDHLAVDYMTRGIRGKEVVRAHCPIPRGAP